MTLEELLIAPEQSLLHQSWEPHHQRHGSVNADGFGVGWYEPRLRPEPARYRSTKPMWADQSFLSMAGIVSTGALLGVVRSATPPSSNDESNIPPFVDGPLLFAHNGAVEGFREGVASKLRRTLTEKRDAGIVGATDSEVVFAMLLDRLDGGLEVTAAVADTVRAVLSVAAARLNLFLVDGTSIVATACGDSVFARSSRGGTIVASEPFDDDELWREIPDNSVVHATRRRLSVSPIDAAEQRVATG